MYHYQHNVMGERADCGKMAAMCGRSTPLAGNADETSSVYIYLWSTPPALRIARCRCCKVWLSFGDFTTPVTGQLAVSLLQP